METKKIRWNVISNIKTVCDAIVDSQMEPKRGTLYQTTILRLNEYFDTTETQTWIMCFGIWQHYHEGTCCFLREFASFLSTNVLNVAEMNDDFIVLRKRNLIEYDENDSSFKVKETVLKNVISNRFLPPVMNSEQSYVDFVEKVGIEFSNRKYTDKTCLQMVLDLQNLEEHNLSMPFVIRSRQMIYEDKPRFFFYDMCHDFLTHGETDLGLTISDIYTSSESFKIAREFFEEQYVLLREGLIEFTVKGNLTDSRLVLTEKGKKLFLDTDYSLYEEHFDEKQMRLPDKIRSKKLFYSKKNEKQISALQNALSPKKFGQIQKRLKDKGLSTGVAVIFHGAAGCGKTETVYQLAKKTGRAIFQVDISDTKSCWFGESEKIIKKVFTDYKKLCEKAKNTNCLTPILLFNECDAVFSKRRDVTTSNTAQVENAIQNIILQEMETLEGILIATTNLVDNLDPAFERRFLFKIRFEKPDFGAKCDIWKNKIKWLSDDDVKNLASNYDFSGGEIDNIVRKSMMQEIVTGTKPDFKDIVEMCSTEKLNNEYTHKLGFAC